jgi:phosphoribosylglycinamide formyltransferase-1
VVISNNSGAKALERAERHGIDAVHLSSYHCPDDEELDRAIVEALRERGVELVCLAGYMKKRGSHFIRAFPNRILNIHPALLPRQVKGCTVSKYTRPYSRRGIRYRGLRFIW